MFLAEKDISTDEVIARWRAGDTVFSVELGGLGPGYEQAIQIALFGILGHWLDKKVNPDSLIKDNRFTEECEQDLTEFLKDVDLSGAMYSIASQTAYQFLKHGYAEIMKKCPEDRTIQVERNFPNYKI